MKHRYLLAHGILWASAIVASAILKAPDFLTLLLLPSLGATAFLLAPRSGQCRGQKSSGEASGG